MLKEIQFLKKRHTICETGPRHPVLLYIHSISVTTTSEHSGHIFSHSTSYQIVFIPSPVYRGEKNISTLNTGVVVPKALFLKWNFMSVIVIVYIPFHHRVTKLFFRKKKAKQREKKKRVRLKCDDERKKLWLRVWGISHLLLRLYFCVRNFLWKKTCRDFCLILKRFLLSFSRENSFGAK